MHTAATGARGRPMANPAATTARKVPGRPFRTGAEWTGNAKGRPKGSKHRLSEDFLAALAEDFDKHGATAIARVRQKTPAIYLRIIAELVPKDFNVNLGLHEDALEALRALG
jgi:hypothetical protein